MEHEQPASLAPRGETPTHLPAPSQQCAGLDAYRQATTLMGAETPGAHGAVQVWGVDERRVARRRRLRTAAWIATLGLCEFGLAHLNGLIPRSPFEVLVLTLATCCFAGGSGLSMGLLLGEQVFRKLSTGAVAMDDAGISFLAHSESADMGLTGAFRNEGRRLHWDNLVAIQVISGFGLAAYTADGKTLSAVLLNYNRRSRQEIIAAICQRAGLEPSNAPVLTVAEGEHAARSLRAIPASVRRTQLQDSFGRTWGSALGWLVLLGSRMRPITQRDLARDTAFRNRLSRWYSRPGYRVKPFVGIERAGERIAPAQLPSPDTIISEGSPPTAGEDRRQGPATG